MTVKSGLALVLGIFLLLPGCEPSNTEPAPAAKPADGVVSGTITYRQKIALPQDAVVKIEIIDASERVRDFVIVAEQTIKNPGAVPIKFQISYPPDKIDPNHQYRLHVRIEDGAGHTLFTGAREYPVITRGSPTSVDVIVDRNR